MNTDASEMPPVPGSSGGVSVVVNSGLSPEIPEGVDPSFLAALPDEMREEVIAEQLRYNWIPSQVFNSHAFETFISILISQNLITVQKNS